MEFKNDSSEISSKIEADLYDHVRDNEHNTFLNSSHFDKNVIKTTIPITTITSSSESIPESKLGIQFNGNLKSLLFVIEKVKEISRVSNVSKS